jgi:uncharacterized protein YjgD (DUF1641 family)
MAEPIKEIRFQIPDPEKQKQQDLKELEEALLKHKDAVLEIMEIAGYLKQRGILGIVKGLLGQGDKVLDILVNTANMHENKNTIKNILLLLGTIGMINVTQLEPFLLKLNAGVARVAESEGQQDGKMGYIGLARALKDPEINRAITLILEFLKGMGQDIDDLEKNDPSSSPDEKQMMNSGETLEPKVK